MPFHILHIPDLLFDPKDTRKLFSLNARRKKNRGALSLVIGQATLLHRTFRSTGLGR